MTLTNCSLCQYFNHNSHHRGDIVCAQNPAYASMWQRLKSLDTYTLNCIPVDDCGDFDLDLAHLEKEITLSLTFAQWQHLAYESSNISLIDALRNLEVSSRVNLTLSQWQTLANSTTDSQVLSQLELEGIKSDRSIKQWIRVESSCIEAIAFDSSTERLKIRFVSDLVYEYDNVTSDIFDEFCNAYSKGRYFNHHIKDIYPYQLIG